VTALWLSALAVLVADQLTKGIVTQTFAPGESRVAIPHVLWWTYVQNTHGAFGLFGDSAALLIVMAMIVLGVFWAAFREAARHSLLMRIAFGAIVGGATGNIIDRLHYHYVIDFIDLHWWPVFNVADSCISIGVIVLVLASLRRDMRARASSAPPTQAP
jgi:signal peptidase II